MFLQLTSKNKTSPQKDDIPTRVLEVCARHPCSKRSRQDPNRAQLEGPVYIHINRTIDMYCG